MRVVKISAAELIPYSRNARTHSEGQVSHLEKLMDGTKAALIFTDPPYGVSIGNKNKMLNECRKKSGQGKWRKAKKNCKR